MRLGKAHSVKQLGVIDDVLYSGGEDLTAVVDLPLTKLDAQLPHLRLCPSGFINNKLDVLEQQLSGDDFARLTETRKIEKRQLGQSTFYKTSSSLSVYFFIVDVGRSPVDERRLLLCLGYGEYQPMRYLVTAVSIHELN